MKILLAFFLSITVAVSYCRALDGGGDSVRGLSPYSFGLAEARSGADRYAAILKTHQAAVRAGLDVDYTGIDSLEIEIPDQFVSIPLTRNNDFKGCMFHVKNTARRAMLFTLKEEETPVRVEAWMIDSGDFRSVPQLADGRMLLIVEDDNPWVERRKGYEYGHRRRDIMLVENGRATNATVMPYNNEATLPVCKFANARGAVVVRNLTFNRDTASTEIVSLLDISGCDSVIIGNLTINTPESNLVDDNVVNITDCTNVMLSDVSVNGTYSRTDYSGYGISLDNVWNFYAKNLYGNAKWGVFGTNNVNKARIDDSEINRFDIHCYGRDVSFVRVKFFSLYNQFSSMYGNLTFEQCEFRDFIPVQIETSYNAYTEFDITIDSCVYYTTPKKDFLVSTGSMADNPNPRPELSEKRLPNVSVQGLKVVSLDSGKTKRRVAIFRKSGNLIRKFKIKNTIKL